MTKGKRSRGPKGGPSKQSDKQSANGGGVCVPSGSNQPATATESTANGSVAMDKSVSTSTTGSTTTVSPPKCSTLVIASSPEGVATPNTPSQPAPISFLNRNSTADNGPLIVSSDDATRARLNAAKGKSPQQPIGTRGANCSPTRPRVWFTSDVGPDSQAPGGHYLKIRNLSGRQVSETMKLLETHYDWNTKVTGLHCPTPSDGNSKLDIYVRFDDVREARAAFDQIELVDPALTFVYVGYHEYLIKKSEATNGTCEETAYYDGQLMFVCDFQGASKDFMAAFEGLENRIVDLAEQHGDVLAATHVEVKNGRPQYRVEYYRISDAHHAASEITTAKPAIIDGCWTVVTKTLDEVDRIAPSGNVYHLESVVATPHRTQDQDGTVLYTSPTGRTAWRVDANGNTIPLAPPTTVQRCTTRGTPAHGPGFRSASEPSPMTPVGYMGTPMDPRSLSWPNPAYTEPPRQNFYGSGRRNNQVPDGPNKIYRQKIVDGIDVRTSVMIRNLPNEMTFRTLKDLLDTTSWGRYDFSYLRIDFHNNKNVGYGFVNFLDAMDIIPFYDMYYNKPWVPSGRINGRRCGMRIADVSYATVQGFDCLVEKMRNSSVMDENRDFRPKLWWTDETAPRHDMIGTEKAFPNVNNPSKKQRSRDNATQIGLYSSGNRGRRQNQSNGYHQSQYDRGTTAQIQEEAMFNQASPMHNGMLNGMQNGYVFPNPPPMMVGPSFNAGPSYNTGPSYNAGASFNAGPAFNGVPPPVFPPIYNNNINNGMHGGMNNGMNGPNMYSIPFNNPMNMYNVPNMQGPAPSMYGHQVQFSDPFINGQGYGQAGPSTPTPSYFQGGGRGARRPHIYTHPNARGSIYHGSADSGHQAVSPSGDVPDHSHRRGSQAKAGAEEGGEAGAGDGTAPSDGQGDGENGHHEQGHPSTHE